MRTSSYKNLRHRKNTIRKKNQRKRMAKWMDNVYPSNYYYPFNSNADNTRVHRYYSSRRAGSAKSILKRYATRLCRHYSPNIAFVGGQYKKSYNVFWNLY